MPDEPRSTAEHYHQQTKYSPFNLGGPGLDWDNAPEKFKNFDTDDMISLRDRLPFKAGQIYVDAQIEDVVGPPSLDAISRILFCTYGVTAVVAGGGTREFFRAAPSAGALYPTDVYVLVRDHPELDPGCYYFSPIDHSLANVADVGFGPDGDEIWQALAIATHNNPAVAAAQVTIVLGCTVWRSQWRYGQRAYRRCLLDTGHVLGNLCAYAPIEGFTPIPIGGFVDMGLASLLGARLGEDEFMCIVPLLDSNHDPDDMATACSLPSTPFAPILKADEKEVLPSLAEATRIQLRDPRRLGESLETVGPAWASLLQTDHSSIVIDNEPPALREALMPTILRRRSTRKMTGEPLTAETLGGLLEYAYRYDLAAFEIREIPRFFALESLDTWVVVNNVSSMAPGVYRYLHDERRLVLMEEGDNRITIKHIGLGQDLASDASAVVLHTANLARAVQRFGNRAYRYLHLDAGHLGQRLNQLAVAGGLGVSGIGGFFDDDVNGLLGLTKDHICVYMTCLGRSADAASG